MAAGETARPPPGNPSPPPESGKRTFIVKLFYPNSLALAKNLSSLIRKRAEDTLNINDPQRKKPFAGRAVETDPCEDLPRWMIGVHADVVILGIDEFCNLGNLFAQVKQCFTPKAAIIVHMTEQYSLSEADQIVLLENNAHGPLIGYEMKDIELLFTLLDSAARGALASDVIVVDQD